MTPDQPKPTKDSIAFGPKGLRDYHDEPRPYEGNPKPTGEWTVSPIGEILHNGEVMATAFTYKQGKACVDAINAALAAERTKGYGIGAGEQRDFDLEEMQQLREQLAAERSAKDRLLDALKEIADKALYRDGYHAKEIAETALAKLK